MYTPALDEVQCLYKLPGMATSFASLEGVELPAFGAASSRADAALRAALVRATAEGCPPRLSQALNYAVFPGGARLRPQLSLIASAACGDGDPAAAEAAAASVEFLHCASLVHDDLPCFDDADFRRGRPSVHKVFGEAIAVLAGDSLIVLAFGVLGRLPPPKSTPMVVELSKAGGASGGIAAGQAWEAEVSAPLDEYHRAKTASLFAAAAAMGAIAVGGQPGPWRRFGERVGRAYQAADDLADAVGHPAFTGKSTRRDAALGRPSLVRAEGLSGARARLAALLDDAFDAAPSVDDRSLACRWLEQLSARLNKAPANGDG
jgi:geranylgeranyl diphosphate synthase type II